MAKRAAKNRASLKKLAKLSGMPALLVLIGAILAAIVGFFTLRPELFFLCTLILIFAVTALVTNNRVLNSMVIAGLPLYSWLFMISLVYPAAIHFVNFALIVVVTIKNWKNASPLFVIVGSIFYSVYIQAFIIAVHPEFGIDDPYYKFYNIWAMLGVIASGFVVGLLLKYKMQKWW